MKKTRKIKVIGVGGIGSYLIDPLARYLSHTEDNCEITIIDGDRYEERNRERQKFLNCQNKATETMNLLKDQFPNVHFRSKEDYVTEDNVITTIREGDVVFMCVDNHATRKTVSQRCSELDNVTLISGGNDYTDGNVIVYLRKDGEDITKSPVDLYPRIAQPEDKNPGELTAEERQGCQVEAVQNPQLLFTNFAIASMMLNCYRKCEQNKFNYHQVYVDIETLRARPAPEQF